MLNNEANTEVTNLLPAGEEGTVPNEGEISTDAVVTEPVPGTEGTAVENDSKPKWFQRRIDQLTFEKHESRRAEDALKQQNADLLAQLAESRRVRVEGIEEAEGEPARPTIASKSQAPISEAEIESRAQAKAFEIARQNEFNRACNKVYDAGKESFDDFDQALKTFQMLGGLPSGLLETVTEMENGHKLLHAMGKDPDLAERILKLTPAKAAYELARLETKLEKPEEKPVSKAPKPVRIVDAGARTSEHDPEKMSMEEYVKWREKTATTRRSR